MLLGANPAAADVLAGGAPIGALPLAFDSAMPALVALRLALGADGTFGGARQPLALTFWTARGARTWRSEAQAVQGASPGVVLVHLLPEREPASPPPSGWAGPGRELRHLAHELRTPLSAILSLADVLQGGHLGAIANARHRDYLVNMRDTARHALAVIETMLEHPSGLREAALPAAGLDLERVIVEVVAGMSGLAARSGATLSVVTGTGGALVAADATAVRQMLINLVANSLAHAGGGVTVTIMTGTGAGRQVWAEVADNGPGLPASVIVRLASRAALEAPDSSGRPQLGLSLTRALAEANGGRLELASGPAGARARLIFAAYQPPGADQVAASSSG